MTSIARWLGSGPYPNVFQALHVECCISIMITSQWAQSFVFPTVQSNCFQYPGVKATLSPGFSKSKQFTAITHKSALAGTRTENLTHTEKVWCRQPYAKSLISPSFSNFCLYSIDKYTQNVSYRTICKEKIVTFL